MNTSKQVNVMVGLLMVGAIATLLYFLWDNVRADDATERQVRVNAERGGIIFAVVSQCRSCHGITGQSAKENPTLPGALLNDPSNRQTDAGKVKQLQDRFHDTIRCGRVGTLMPSWSQDYGGALNDFQILQLVTLITGSYPGQDISADPNAVSEAGWEKAIQQANAADEFVPAKHLDADISDKDTTLVLDNARGLRPDGLLRIDDDPTDAVYEVVKIVDAPAGTILNGKAARSDDKLTVQEAAIFKAGDIITVDEEVMQVTAAPAQTKLKDDVTADATTITVVDPTGLAADEMIKVEAEKMKIDSVSGNTLTVERAIEDTTNVRHGAGALITEEGNMIVVRRGLQGTAVEEHEVKAGVFEVGKEIKVERGSAGTKAADHPKGTEVFNGPIPPATTITGASGTPPCGQKAAEASPSPGASASPGAAVQLTGSASMTMGDNFFNLNGQHNPALAMAKGQTVTISLKNNGSNIHNLRVAGPDDQFNTADDIVSTPQAVPGGTEAKIDINLAVSGTFKYRCDFHPTEMLGTITVP